MFSLRKPPPATQCHTTLYSVCSLVLFLKPVCFGGGKCFIILLHVFVEKHFFRYPAKVYVSSFSSIKHIHGQKIMHVQTDQFRKPEWKPLWQPQFWVCFSVVDFLDGVFILGRVVFSFPGTVCSGLFPRTCANKVLWFCERSINIDANHLKMLPAALFSSLIELPRWRP